MYRSRRAMRLRRQGLSPVKMIFVYISVFFLVTWHQADRVADWFNNVALAHQGHISQVAFACSTFLTDQVAPYGPRQLHLIEDLFLNLLGTPLGLEPSEIIPPFPTTPENLADSAAAPAPAQVLSPPLGSISFAPTSAEMIPPKDLPSKSITAPTQIASLPSFESGLPQARPASEVAEEPEIFNPARVLLLGDSMMLEGLGPPLQRELKKNQGLFVIREGRYGTGLARLDVFDWLAYFDQMLKKHQPDLVIITIGANDTQDMMVEGRRLHVGNDEWNEIYTRRVTQLLSQAAALKVRVLWVGLPIMGQEPYGSRVANINKQTQKVCAGAEGCSFWDSWLAVADLKGKYSTFLIDDSDNGKKIRVRARDAIHLTERGGRIMADKLLAEVTQWINFSQPEPPDLVQKPLADSSDLEPPAPEPASVSSLELTSAPTVAPSAGEGQLGDFDNFPENLPPGVEVLNFYSEFREKETSVVVIKPEPASGAPPGPWPVVFLLHGAWDGPQGWLDRVGTATLAQLATDSGLMLVLPDGEPRGWYLDGRETKIESYLVAELLPQILAKTGADPERVGITGLSMGGHGALSLALKYPRLFQAAGSISGVLDLAAHAGDGHPVNGRLGLTEALGPAGLKGENWQAHSVRGLTENQGQLWEGKPLLITVGRDDGLTIAENRAYHRQLTDLGLEHVYIEGRGGHDWDYWSEMLPLHLEFMSQELRGVQ